MSVSNQSKVVQLLALGVEGLDAVRARNVLQNHNWDVEQAANSLFSGALDAAPDDEMPGLLPNDWSVPATQTNQSPQVTLPTLKDFERNLNNTQRDEPHREDRADTGPVPGPSIFGPSNREDSAQQWAMVPVKQPEASQEITDMDKAIEASLNETFSKAEEYEDPPYSQRVRLPDRPMALRLTHPVQSDALYLQAIFAVPQVRRAFLSFFPVSTPKRSNEYYWRGIESYPLEEGNPPVISLQHVQRLFSFMTLSRRAYLNVDATVELLRGYELLQTSKSLSPTQYHFAQKVAGLWLTSNAEHAPAGEHVEIPTLFRSVLVGDSDGSTMEVDVIDVRHTSVFSDLVSWLRQDLAKGSFLRAAEVLSFHIYRTNELDSMNAPRTRFTFPIQFYCDEFLYANRMISKERMEVFARSQVQVEHLERKRRSLLHPANKDALKTLEATCTYIEQYSRADSHESHARHQQIMERLQSIRGRVVSEAEVIDEELRRARAISSTTFDSSDLKKISYKLRAVIIEDGQYGRRHSFVYLSDLDNRWWKCVDYDVEQVNELDVLTDSTGVHLGGGVSMLIYSRELPDGILSEYAMRDLVQEPYKMDILDDNRRLDSELPGTTAVTSVDDVGEVSSTGLSTVDDDTEMDVDASKPS